MAKFVEKKIEAKSTQKKILPKSYEEEGVKKVKK